MIKEFTYQFKELGITPHDLGQLMGYEEQEVPEPFPVLINEALDSAPGLCEIRGGFRIFSDISVMPSEKIIRINSQKFHAGEIVTIQLKKSVQAALFICTAGGKISESSNKLMHSGNMMEGYVLDVLGSVAVEKAMDKIQDELLLFVQQNNMGISDRFSPGYCDWNVSEQQKLFDLMPIHFCGVKLSETSLMDPVKSVSGIIGIGPELKQKGYQCNWCNDKNCVYGNIRRRSKVKYY